MNRIIDTARSIGYWIVNKRYVAVLATFGLVFENLAILLTSSTGGLVWPGWGPMIVFVATFAPKVGAQAKVWSKDSVTRMEAAMTITRNRM